RTGTACVTTRLRFAVLRTGVSPRASKRRAFQHWCRWSTAVSVPPCCLNSQSMPACFRVQTSLPDHCSAMKRSERLASSGAAAPGAAMNFACLQKNSWNAPSRNQNLPISDYLIYLDRDSAEAVHVAFNIILEVPIGSDAKWHSGIHCLNARLSRAKPTGAGQTILGVVRFFARGLRFFRFKIKNSIFCLGKKERGF